MEMCRSNAGPCENSLGNVNTDGQTRIPKKCTALITDSKSVDQKNRKKNGRIRTCLQPEILCDANIVTIVGNNTHSRSMLTLN